MGPAAIALVAVLRLAHTWRTWPDPIVDFGRELYVAWQIAEGRTLYVDLAYFSGPLSPYLDALWFRIFGPGVLTLALANIALGAVLVALLYQLIVRVSSRLAATAASLTFVLIFACAQFTKIGNYNWVCPYSHELTHGLLLVVAGLWCLDRYHRTRRVGWIAGLGLASGLVVLTKAEMIFAGALAVATGLGLTLVAERPSARHTFRLLAVFAGAAAAPLVVTFACFATAMPVEQVLRWPLGHWRAAARPELSGSEFYAHGMGTDNVWGNLGQVATATFWYAVVLGAGLVVARVARGVRAAPAAAFVVSAAILAYVVPIEGWVAAARPLPFFMAVAVAASLVGFLRRGRDPAFALRAALAVLALALLAKIVLNVRVFHYGFVLAMPATVLLVVALIDWLPAAAERLGARAAILRAVVLGALVVAIAAQLRHMEQLLDRKTRVVGRGVDAILTDGRARHIDGLLEQIRARVAPSETLVSLPEGAMLNYLARRHNPTPFYLFDGTTRLLWGEETITRAVESKSPDWVVLVDRGPGGAGSVWFGRTAFKELYAWIQARYRPVWQIGTPFTQGPGYKVMLMRRASS